MYKKACPIFLAALALFTSIGLFAQEVEESAIGDSTRSLQRAINKRDETIQHLLTRIEQLEKRVRQIEVGHNNESQAKTEVDAIRPEPVNSPVVQKEMGNETRETVTSDAAAGLDELGQKEQDRLIRAAFEQTLIERGGLLLPPRTYVLEPSFSYVHSSADNILIDGFIIPPVLVIGDIISQRVRRDQAVAAVTARLGLPWDSQVEIRVPYGYQTRKTYSADNEEESVSNNGLGDVEIALSHQLYRSRGEWPDLLTSLRWKSDTGDGPFEENDEEIFLGAGYDSFDLSFTTVKVVDPVVYFGGINYTYNSSIDEDIGHFDPGDSFGFDLGLAIALNLNSSLSLSYDQQFTSRSKLNGNTIPGSYLTTGVFSVGGSYTLTDTLTIDTSLGIGVTSDSPDVLFSVSFPFRGKL